MRCLTLARALAERGALITFASSAATLDTVPALAGSEFPAITLERPMDTDELTAPGRHWDAVVVDHYALDARHEAALRRAAPVVSVIDDLADRTHDCDVLCDPTVGRARADYAALIPPSAVACLGPSFALLRPEFARARPIALAKHAAARPVERIFVSFGMTDIDGITAWAVRATLDAGLEAEIAVALDSRAESLPQLKSLAEDDPRLVLHPDCRDMCTLMADSDIAVGAGGTTSWERCCLGLPTIIMVIAQNQARIARSLARIGAAELLTDRDAAALAARLRRLAADQAARVAMSRTAGALADGKGAARLAEILMSRIPARQAGRVK
jgi:UDP-2,4-diacetamido-2,4,6-trideoxy-beta-L-altropyranose hydrolase